MLLPLLECGEWMCSSVPVFWELSLFDSVPVFWESRTCSEGFWIQNMNFWNQTEHQSIFLLFFCASVVLVISRQIFSSKTCRNAATIDHTSRERVTVCSFFFFVKTNLLLTIADVVRHHPFHHNKTVNLPRVPSIGAQCRRISHAGAPHTLPGSGRRGKLAWWWGGHRRCRRRPERIM